MNEHLEQVEKNYLFIQYIMSNTCEDLVEDFNKCNGHITTAFIKLKNYMRNE